MRRMLNWLRGRKLEGDLNRDSVPPGVVNQAQPLIFIGSSQVKQCVTALCVVNDTVSPCDSTARCRLAQ